MALPRLISSPVTIEVDTDRKMYTATQPQSEGGWLFPPHSGLRSRWIYRPTGEPMRFCQEARINRRGILRGPGATFGRCCNIRADGIHVVSYVCIDASWWHWHEPPDIGGKLFSQQRPEGIWWLKILSDIEEKLSWLQRPEGISWLNVLSDIEAKLSSLQRPEVTWWYYPILPELYCSRSNEGKAFFKANW